MPHNNQQPARPSRTQCAFTVLNNNKLSLALSDGLAIAGALTGNPVLAGVGLGISIGSTALSGALNYSQGDYAGLAGDGAGIAASLIPGGRIARRIGGAALDPGRNSAGRFISNWRAKQAAQDIATQGMQGRVAGAGVASMGCPR